MAIETVHLGHWRALERTWLREFRTATKLGRVAVVTAGTQQTARLAKLLDGTVAGHRFFPGIPFLAGSLAGYPVSEKVTAAQSLALAFKSGYTVDSAASAARFFEHLLENGITSDMFLTQSLSLREPDPEVTRTAGRFLKYQEIRDSEFPFSPDSAVRNDPPCESAYRTVMFYGFYDLNPGQRSYIRKLSASLRIIWFSPVHPSHHWRTAFERTLSFLRDMCRKEDLHRADGDQPLSSMAQFAENLLTGKALQHQGNILLKRCGSGSAFTRAVAGETAGMDLPYSEIAVVASGENARAIITELYCAGIPCRRDLTARASELPWGRLVLRLNSLPDNDFHHSEIEGLLSTGLITAPGTPGPVGYAAEAARIGARFGRSEMERTGFGFAETIGAYFASMYEKDLPLNYLGHLRAALLDLCPGSLPGYALDCVLRDRIFVSGAEVPFSVFRRMVEKALDEPVRLAKGSPEGVRILSPEQVRGALYEGMILTGLEEGRFPGRTVNDPRLPPEMKELLQMPPPDNRETEDAFLLRQVFEAAGSRLVILVESTDGNGNPVALSPFLSRLKDEKGNPWKNTVQRENIPSMPSVTLSFPADPPFLSASLETQRERVLFDHEDPSPDAVHCGMIGPGCFTMDRISATVLENYLRDPHRFLREQVWKAEAPEEFPVRSEPEPKRRGSLVHCCVELALSTGTSVPQIVRRVAQERELEGMLGSKELAEIWIRHAVEGVESLMSQLRGRNWEYRESEMHLEGTVAGYPAKGRIDLVFNSGGRGLILADLKTGRPGGMSRANILKKKKLQLPFYRQLALQNGYSPVTSACYIHLQGSGAVTFEELSGEDLDEIQNDFETLVKETVERIRNGVFPPVKEKKWQGKGR